MSSALHLYISIFKWFFFAVYCWIDAAIVTIISDSRAHQARQNQSHFICLSLQEFNDHLLRPPQEVNYAFCLFFGAASFRWLTATLYVSMSFECTVSLTFLRVASSSTALSHSALALRAAYVSDSASSSPSVSFLFLIASSWFLFTFSSASRSAKFSSSLCTRISGILSAIYLGLDSLSASSENHSFKDSSKFVQLESEIFWLLACCKIFSKKVGSDISGSCEAGHAALEIYFVISGGLTNSLHWRCLLYIL